MKNLFLGIALIAAAAMPGQSAIIYVTEAPASLTTGQTVEWTVSLRPQGGEILTGYQLNVGFSEWLMPGDVTELGYFADNGLAFFEGFRTSNSITFILDVLGGGASVPAGIDPLITIPFIATQDGTPDLLLFDPIITTAGGGDALLSIEFTPPVIIDAPGASVPEPSTVTFASVALSLIAIARWRAR
jgi:hypothetical protein